MLCVILRPAPCRKYFRFYSYVLHIIIHDLHEVLLILYISGRRAQMGEGLLGFGVAHTSSRVDTDRLFCPSLPLTANIHVFQMRPGTLGISESLCCHLHCPMRQGSCENGKGNPHERQASMLDDTAMLVQATTPPLPSPSEKERPHLAMGSE